MSLSLEAAWSMWAASALLLLNRPLGALRRIDRFLERQPDDPRALATRAHVLASVGEPAAALQCLSRLVQVRSGHAPDWFNYGFLCETQGLTAEAEAAFRQALALDPLLDRAWYGLGLCLIRLQRLEEAVHVLQKNTELQPMSPSGWYQLARVRLELQQPAEALKIIRHLHRFEPRVAARLEQEAGLKHDGV